MRVAWAWSVMAPSACVLQRRLPAVQHQHRIECRRIERRRDPAPDRDLPDLRMSLHLDVGMQRNPHQDGGVLEHPRDVQSVAQAITIFIVAAVVHEQWIVRILAEADPCASLGETVPVSRL